MSHPSSWFKNMSSKTQKMEAIYSSETSVDFQQTTRRYVQEESSRLDHRCENRGQRKTTKNLSRDRTHYPPDGSSEFYRCVNLLDNTVQIPWYVTSWLERAVEMRGAVRVLHCRATSLIRTPSHEVTCNNSHVQVISLGTHPTLF
jgi:hypothetical protein